MRLLLLSGLVTALIVIAAAPAHAATFAGKSNGELVVNAGAGRANTINVSLAGGIYTVTDNGDTVTALPGCFATGNPNTVQCFDTGVGRVAAFSNDLNDSVTVTASTPSRIDGGSGDDVLNVVQGFTSLTGGSGTDRLLGGTGDDRLDGGSGADVLDGGGGVDRVDYGLRATGVTVTLDGAPNDGEPGEGDNALVENIVGGSGADSLTGGAGVNVIAGLGGNDSLNGLGGDDRFIADDGADTFSGGAGTDLADYSARATAVTVDLDGVADDGAAGEADNARPDVEDIAGGSANDRLIGHAGPNILDGYGGNDRLDGLGGNDRLRGGDGDDDLFGGGGDDNLFGGDGNDTLFGGPGSDGLRGEAGNDFLAGPVDGAGDSMVGGLGYDECGGDHFDSITTCEGQ